MFSLSREAIGVKKGRIESVLERVPQEDLKRQTELLFDHLNKRNFSLILSLFSSDAQVFPFFLSFPFFLFLSFFSSFPFFLFPLFLYFFLIGNSNEE